MKQLDSMAPQDVDLFGRPVEALRERRGRPSYAKTEENQRFVEVRAAAGWSQKAIAADMGIDEDTLRKHFSGELQNASLKLQGMMLDVLQQRARQGHVPSIRELQAAISATAPKAGRGAKKDAPAVDPEIPLVPEGKKARALAAAQNVPEAWGDLMARRDKDRH